MKWMGRHRKKSERKGVAGPERTGADWSGWEGFGGVRLGAKGTGQERQRMAVLGWREVVRTGRVTSGRTGSEGIGTERVGAEGTGPERQQTAGV